MAGNTCDDALGLVSKKNAQTPTVTNASRLGIELVQSVVEILEVGGRRFLNLEATSKMRSVVHFHSSLQPAVRWRLVGARYARRRLPLYCAEVPPAPRRPPYSIAPRPRFCVQAPNGGVREERRTRRVENHTMPT